jgi:tetratricopeptide (TPR) repeat protein
VLPPESDNDAQSALAEAWPLIERAGRPRVLAEYDSACAMRVCFSNPALAREHFESALRHFRSAGAERSALSIANNLADCTWGTGDLDAAVAGMRDAIALIRRSSTSAKSALGLGLGNFAGVLTERGDIDEALAVMAEAIPLISEIGWFYRFGDHFGLRLAKAGHADAAARLLGYVDCEHARFERHRLHNEVRARANLLRILNEAMSPAELARRRAEGAQLTEDEAARLALTK